MPDSVLQDVEARVNDLVLSDLSVEAELMTQQQAREIGAMALFGEKYGDQVRVISVGDWARELCGGTHAGRSGQLGVIKLLGESSIGSGVRRVEALVGADAYQFLAREHVLVAQLTDALKVRPEELPERVNDIVERLRAAEKEIDRVRVASLLSQAGELAASARDVYGVRFVGSVAEGADGGDVRRLALDIRGRMPGDVPAVVTIVGTGGGSPTVVIALNDTARELGSGGRRPGQGRGVDPGRRRWRQGRRGAGRRHRCPGGPTGAPGRRARDRRARDEWLTSPTSHRAVRHRCAARRRRRRRPDRGGALRPRTRCSPLRSRRSRAVAVTWPGWSS